MRKRAGSGMTMTRGQRKAIQRSVRRQRMVWGGVYSCRGMNADVFAVKRSLQKVMEKKDTQEIEKIQKRIQQNTEKLTVMGRILARLGFGRKG